MATIKKAFNRHSYTPAVLVTIVGVALLVFLLTGCGVKTTSPDPDASSAAVAEGKPAEEAPPVNNFIKPFGEIVTYDDGVSVSVGLIGPFTPSNLDYMPLAAGETALIFKVVLTNNSEKVLEPGAIAQANSGGKPATYIADVGNAEYGSVGLFPTTSILPGQTLEWFTAFGVTNPEDVTLEIAPYPFGYDNAIFTNTAF